MPRLINPVEWRVESTRPEQCSAPLLSLANAKGHRFHVHPIESGLVRVVHSLPALQGHPVLRNHERGGQDGNDTGVDGFVWEERRADWHVWIDEGKRQACIKARGGHLQVNVDFSYTVTLSWYWNQPKTNDEGRAEGVEVEREPFLSDFKSAYTYDARTERVYHQVCRQQSYMPLSEHARPANENHIPQTERFEFIYGLGESKGPMMKDGKRYLMDARDSLAADPQDTDPLYKLCPFYMHYNCKTAMWYGLYYNTLSPSIFDFSAEHDFATGQFRSFSAESGPLDYYLLLGQVESSMSSLPAMPLIVSQLARLVTPYSSGPASEHGWQASPSLPALKQFGYLASSLTLSERSDAQRAVVGYVEEARDQGFPIDSMHLSSGYALDSRTGERNYFTWDAAKYPDPAALGRRLEKELNCTVIINVKPWLLETHSDYSTAALHSAFVRAAPDARPSAQGRRPSDEDRCGPFASQPARTMHWSKGMGVTGKGSYFDYSSHAGCQQWQRLIQSGVLDNGISGVWIDNNEFSSLVDDEEELKGEIDMWSLPERIPACLYDGKDEEGARKGSQVAARMGWRKRATTVGSVGRSVLTMGMARATYEHLYKQLPNQRPVVVTRSAVPGIQAFAHASWSGDNSTSWLSLKWSTKLTLSLGLSFGVGLYGHDVGGFAGEHSPSPELLIRWCQQSMWHTRFTIHSWKKISTTPWMYGKAETEMIRAIVLLRYRLVPTLYSLFVTHFHRHGWPVLKPLLWYHSKDFDCLTIDEHFLVGTHILVAPVCDAGSHSTTVHLPSQVDDDDSDDACWFELEANRWHRPSRQGHSVTLDAPLDRCPTLVRDGGIFVLGPPITHHLATPAPFPRNLTVAIYPTPVHVLLEREKGQDVSHGIFTLVEDDGCTNEAAERGVLTEFDLCFTAFTDRVVASATTVKAGYSGIWNLLFVLPKDDGRRIELSPASDQHVPSSNTIRIPVLSNLV